jgi:hypothetical protein
VRGQFESYEDFVDRMIRRMSNIGSFFEPVNNGVPKYPFNGNMQIRQIKAKLAAQRQRQGLEQF